MKYIIPNTIWILVGYEKKISNYDFINVSIVSLTALIYKTSTFVNSRAGYSGSMYAG